MAAHVVVEIRCWPRGTRYQPPGLILTKYITNHCQETLQQCFCADSRAVRGPSGPQRETCKKYYFFYTLTNIQWFGGPTWNPGSYVRILSFCGGLMPFPKRYIRYHIYHFFVVYMLTYILGEFWYICYHIYFRWYIC